MIKICRLKCVAGTFTGVSIRGPAGKGANDPPQPHIEAAGFKPNDDVFLIDAEDLIALARAAASSQFQEYATLGQTALEKLNKK